MSTVKTEYVSTDQLKEGDTVLCYGMVLILGPKNEGRSDANGPVYWFRGQVQNPEDIKSDRMIWSLLYTSWWDEGGIRGEGGWTPEYSGVWTIQGNHLASWTRVVND